MRRDGENTRGRILDAANELILKSGYGGTTVDEVIAKAGLTKGAFFYHFKSKEDLARSLVLRYAETDRGHLEAALKFAEERGGDAATKLISFVTFFIDFLATEGPTPDGCLYASYCYEAGLLEKETMAPVREMVLLWREKLLALIRAAVAQTPPRLDVDLEALADQTLVAFEGGFVLSKTLEDPTILVKQLQQLRAYLTLLFAKEKV